MRTMDFTRDELLKVARERSGLSDFENEDFLEALDAYLDALRGNYATFTDTGALIAYEEVVAMLAGRLKIENYIRQNPEIKQIKISRPVFVTGLYRSGTSKLQGLLASDPRWIAPKTWQVSQPVPIAEPIPGEDDPRIAAVGASLEHLRSMAPHAMLAHPLEVMHPSEDYALMLASFRLVDPKQINSGFDVWLKSHDKTPMYRDLHRALQVLQFQFAVPGVHEQRFCLKAPAHLGNIEALMTVFPDAKVIFTHRNPFHSVHSFAMLRESLYKVYKAEVDSHALGRETLEQAATALDGSLAARKQFRPNIFFDLSFNDIVHDPLRRIEEIYHFLETPLTETVRERLMGAALRGEEHKSRAPSHDPALYGLYSSAVHDRLRDYMNWAEEHIERF